MEVTKWNAYKKFAGTCHKHPGKVQMECCQSSQLKNINLLGSSVTMREDHATTSLQAGDDRTE